MTHHDALLLVVVDSHEQLIGRKTQDPARQAPPCYSIGLVMYVYTLNVYT